MRCPSYYSCVFTFVVLLNLGLHPEALGRSGQGENSFWRHQRPGSIWTHASSIIPHSTASSIKSQNHQPPPPNLTTLQLLEEASKHECNYNQTHTLCSVTCCAGRSANPHRSNLLPGCPRLISSRHIPAHSASVLGEDCSGSPRGQNPVQFNRMILPPTAVRCARATSGMQLISMQTSVKTS